MIKKIIYISIISCMIFSCGKKGDPEYKDLNSKSDIQAIFIIKI